MDTYTQAVTAQKRKAQSGVIRLFRVRAMVPQLRRESVPFCTGKSWEMQLWNGRMDRCSSSAVPFCAHEKPPLFL
jgi:hypothetical protein